MSRWILSALLFQFVTPVTSSPRDWWLDVDVFRGAGAASSATSSAAPTATRILAPWAAGWSNDAERLRIQIRDVTGLARALLILRERLTQEKRTRTIRGSDYWVAVRFLPPDAKSVPVEVRLVQDDDAATGAGSLPAVRLSAELGRTVVVTGGSRDEPIFAALTFRDPLTLPVRGAWPPRSLHPIRPIYPESARRTGPAGTVTVRALIDSDGAVVEPFVLESLHPDLDAAALRAVRDAAYQPATVQGKPVPAMLTLTCRFSRPSR